MKFLKNFKRDQGSQVSKYLLSMTTTFITTFLRRSCEWWSKSDGFI